MGRFDWDARQTVRIRPSVGKYAFEICADTVTRSNSLTTSVVPACRRPVAGIIVIGCGLFSLGVRLNRRPTITRAPSTNGARYLVKVVEKKIPNRKPLTAEVYSSRGARSNFRAATAVTVRLGGARVTYENTDSDFNAFRERGGNDCFLFFVNASCGQ